MKRTLLLIVIALVCTLALHTAFAESAVYYTESGTQMTAENVSVYNDEPGLNGGWWIVKGFA